MLKRLSARERLRVLAAEFEPKLRDAFFEAIDDIKSTIVLAAIVERLERSDVAGALDALNIDPVAFRPLERALLAAYEGGGIAVIENLPRLSDPSGGRVVIRFDVRAPRAERYVREYSAGLVTRIVADQREALRVAMEAGLVSGRNPNAVALDLVGRINRVTGRREGGLIGLTAQQERAAALARGELLSGEPDQLRAYLQRRRRDRHFDKVVTAAIRDGKPIPTATVQRMIGRYSDRLLQLRGETIARTEILTALHAAKDEAFRQTVDTGAVQEAAIKKVWIARRDRHSRDHHAAADGERVGLNERFSTGLLYPHEPGAPASETVNCRCDFEHVIDFLHGIGTDF